MRLEQENENAAAGPDFTNFLQIGQCCVKFISFSLSLQDVTLGFHFAPEQDVETHSCGNRPFVTSQTMTVPPWSQRQIREENCRAHTSDKARFNRLCVLCFLKRTAISRSGRRDALTAVHSNYHRLIWFLTVGNTALINLKTFHLPVEICNYNLPQWLSLLQLLKRANDDTYTHAHAHAHLN